MNLVNQIVLSSIIVRILVGNNYYNNNNSNSIVIYYYYSSYNVGYINYLLTTNSEQWKAVY